MAHLQIISLFKNKPAQELTSAEVNFINDYLQQHPELISTLGGQSVVDNYLANAVEPNPADDFETGSSETDQPEQMATADFKRPERPWIFRITALLMVAIIGWGSWFGMRQAGIDFLASKPGKKKTSRAQKADPDQDAEAKETVESTVTDSAAETDGLWYGWKIETVDKSPVLFRPDWTFSDQAKPTAQMVPVIQGQTTTFSISRRVEKDDWLALHFKTLETGSAPGLIEININDELYNRIPLPLQANKDPYLIPLHDYQDQQLKLHLTVTPGDDKQQLQWNRLQFFQQPRSTKWYPVELVNIRSQAGTELVIGDDKIITAQRGGPGIETYVAQVSTSLPNVTAFRLEAFPEPGVIETRRPRHRKWNYMDTSFVLSNFRVMTAASQHKKISGRYVKLMTNQERTYLSLAEVQVFSDGKNVALQGKATQSMPDKKMGAAMAIDNRLTADGYRTEDGKYARSMVRTRGTKGPAWWQVDLGKTYDIDRIVVHSPTSYSQQRLLAKNQQGIQRINPFYVMVLSESDDPANDLVWESELIQQPPSPSLELTDSDSKSLIISSAATDMLGHEDMVQDSLLSTPAGWNLPEYFQKTQQAVFTLREAAVAGPAGFVVRLGHNMHSRAPTLGKFRLSVTNAQPPFQFAPPGTVVWSQNEQPLEIAAAKSPETSSQPQVPQPNSQTAQDADRKAAEAKVADLAKAAARTAELKAAQEAEVKRQEAEKVARQQVEEARRTAQQKDADARRLAQQKRQEALKKAQQKRQEVLRKAQKKREADAKKRAEQLAARRKADAKRREEQAKKRAADAKRKADQDAARRKADAQRREDEAKKRAAEAKRKTEQEAARKKAEQAKKSAP